MLRLVADPASKTSLEEVQVALNAILTRNDLGFWQLPLRDYIWADSQKQINELKNKYQRLIVLGMGGSALGGRAIVESASENKSAVHFIYNSDPQSFIHFLNHNWSPKQDGWLIISKSGNTIEVLSMLSVLLEEMRQKKIDYTKQICVITEKTNNPLHTWCENTGVPSVAHPLDVGGRFSALTPVGLLPAGFADVSISSLREGADWVLKNQAMVTEFSAVILDRFKAGEGISVFWSYVDRLNMLLPWIEQLWAESLGKNENVKVSSPMLAYGTAYQHSVLQQYMEGRRDKFFIFFRADDLQNSGPVIENSPFQGSEWIRGKNLGQIFSAESIATEKALSAKGRFTMSMSSQTVDARVVGSWILFFELVVATLGQAVGINPFDQPGVELGKKIAREILNG